MIIFLYLITGFIFYLFYCSFKYRNVYKLFMYFGKKGCGKTTHICKHAFKYLKRGYQVYCTEHIPGCHFISYEDVKEIGRYKYPENAVIFIDEVGMIFDNRDFKNFKPEVRDWFKLQRHYKNRVYLYSQHFDIDLKLRNLVDKMYIGKSYFNCISIFKEVRKDLTIVEASSVGESRIADNLVVVPFLIPFSRQITWMPKYHGFFDSFAVPELPTREMPEEPLCEYQVKKWYHRMHFRAQLFLFQKTMVGSAPLSELKYLCKSRAETRKRSLSARRFKHIDSCGDDL